MSKLNIEIDTKQDLQPVSIEALTASIYSALTALQILTDSSQNKGDCDVSCGAIEWFETPENTELVRQSAMWLYLEPLWLYAEKGELVRPKEHLNDVISDLLKWVCAIEAISEYSGENAHTPILKVITKFLARLKLDFQIDLSSGGNVKLYPDLSEGLIGISWLPQISDKNLTIIELALLAGVSNIRTVRNAQYDKDNPLVFIKTGKSVEVEIDVANLWLAKRRGFIATNRS
jgi:hypothetical protein